MTRQKLNEEYFDWICQIVGGPPHSDNISFCKLLWFLHNTDFNYSIGMDSNREADGIDLRYRFGYEYSYERPVIATLLDDRVCSILEMMVALALRCEEHIMGDQNIENRTSQWFWNMIKSLGLDSMNDTEFDENYTEKVISRFLNRNYKPNGEGGLFTVKHSRYDLRTVEIWYQMCLYLDEIT